MELIIAIALISLILIIRALIYNKSKEELIKIVPYCRDKYVIAFVIIGDLLLLINAMFSYTGILFKYTKLAKAFFAPCTLSILFAGISISLVSHVLSHLRLLLFIALIYQTIIYGLIGKLIGSFFKS